MRPPALQDFLRAKQAGKPYDEAAHQQCLTSSVAEVVRQQADPHLYAGVVAERGMSPETRVFH